MATLHIRRFPEPLYHRLAKLATQERRSLSAEVVVLLERELSKWSKSQEKVLTALDRWRLKPSRSAIPSSLELLRADRQR